MNNIEKIVYDLVKGNPKIKIFIRNLYQGIYDILPKKRESSYKKIDIKEDCFLGYHDIQPFSFCGTKILSNKLLFDFTMPQSDDYMEVGYINFNNSRLGEFVKISSSNAWNYHKGCRLQWLNDNTIIFNTTKEKRIVSKQINLLTLESKVLPYPIDSVNHNGKYATSFSYERLEKFMPGYGYNQKDDYSFIEDKAPSNTGLFLLDLESGTSDLIVSLRSLFEKTADEENSKLSSHYVTHSLFSEDGKYISFFHRWVGVDTRKRYTRFMIYNLETKELICLPTGYMVSHYVWNSRNEIIAYCNYNSVDCHALFNIESLEKSRIVAYPILNSDGHQSFITDSSFITDTYADKRRMASLYYVNIKNDYVQKIASVYSPEKFQTKIPTKHIACDLHPRVSRDGRFVCFDSAKSGVRSLAVMNIEGLVK